MYKWTDDYEKDRKEREAQLNEYYNKLIKIKNNKNWEECIKNEHSKT